MSTMLLDHSRSLGAVLAMVLGLSGCAAQAKITSVSLAMVVNQQEGAAAAWRAAAGNVCPGASPQSGPRVTTTSLDGVTDSQQTTVSGTLTCGSQ